MKQSGRAKKTLGMDLLQDLYRKGNMKINKGQSLVAAVDLRQRAEKQLRDKTAQLKLPRTEEETRRLVFELEVHQIELEMQITELIQARFESETALEKYTDLYDSAPVGYFSLNRDGAISAVNLHGIHLLGINRAELTGQRFGLFIAGVDRQTFSAFLEKVLASRDKETFEVTLARDELDPRIVQIEAVADAAGKECRMVVIDVTERRSTEAAFKQKKLELAMCSVWYTHP